mmetsp:Transcript_7120/g.27278  ORF Transcript_7120/g.27278 Transcript_7120/m.27278 type:complete len:325 (-) Transcript_7120:2513-3487(-)
MARDAPGRGAEAALAGGLESGDPAGVPVHGARHLRARRDCQAADGGAPAASQEAFRQVFQIEASLRHHADAVLLLELWERLLHGVLQQLHPAGAVWRNERREGVRRVLRVPDAAAPSEADGRLLPPAAGRGAAAGAESLCEVLHVVEEAPVGVPRRVQRRRSLRGGPDRRPRLRRRRPGGHPVPPGRGPEGNGDSLPVQLRADQQGGRRAEGGGAARGGQGGAERRAGRALESGGPRQVSAAWRRRRAGVHAHASARTRRGRPGVADERERLPAPLQHLDAHLEGRHRNRRLLPAPDCASVLLDDPGHEPRRVLEDNCPGGVSP